MTTSTHEWGRAVIVGAVAGGVFWALAAFAIMTSDGSPAAVTAVAFASIVVIAAGVFTYRNSSSTRNRRLAIGAIVAPLTGAVTIVTFLLGALLVGLVS